MAKLLASRLKCVLDGLISHSQSAFVLGRQILYSVFVANEMVDQETREKKDNILFKFEFEKAYDNVN